MPKRGSLRLDPLALPPYAAFEQACRSGLARPFGVPPLPDSPWDDGPGHPPSHPAFGRLRSLVALYETRALAPRRALEVAAGDGRLAAVLARAGCEVVLNDLRSELLAESLACYGVSDVVRVVPGNLFDLSREALGRFDLVLAREVIEHVAHPDRLLAHLAGFLEPGGHLLLTTPNGLHARNKLPTFSEIGDPSALEPEQFQPDADGHLFLLTPAEIAALAASAGLEVERLGAFGTPLTSGHFKLARIAGPRLVRAAYAAERLAQRLPAWVRARGCVGLSVLLRRGVGRPGPGASAESSDPRP